MKSLIIIPLLIIFINSNQGWDYTYSTTFNCSKITVVQQTDVWNVMILHQFDQFWFICIGSIQIIILILLMLTYKIQNSKTQPSDIILALIVFDFINVVSLIIQSIYYLINSQANKPMPANFSAFCSSIGFFSVLGTTGINIYNIMFCIILAYTVRHTLKGAFFSKKQYHAFSLICIFIVAGTIFLTGTVGKNINGICGFKYTKQSAYLYSLSALVLISITITSVYYFRKRIPKNSFFQNQSVYKYYYYYICLVATQQTCMSIAYLIGDANCRSAQPDPLLNITFSIGNCLQLFHPLLLFFIRYKHPLVKKRIKHLLKKKVQEIDVIKQLYTQSDPQPQYNWLGSLLQSIRASQIFSFLTGMLISHVEFNLNKIKALKPIHFTQHYIFHINQQTADTYMEKRRSARESRRVNHELGGLKPLSYEVTSYCPVVFSFILQQFEKQIRLQKSLNIQNNSGIIKKIADIQGGKSGQFFFFSYDFNILFKTVSKQQVQTYLTNIQAFTEHFNDQPNSLIVKLIGLYKFRRTDITGEEIYIILQKNLSTCDRIHIQRIFDLKGSKYNRETLAEKDDVSDLSALTLKDIDFINIQKKISISALASRNILRILHKDVNFLKGLSVMDYSFLVIKVNWDQIAFFQKKETKEILPRLRNPFEITPSQIDKSLFYHFGIIDYLQTWNYRKQTQRLIKRVITRQFNDSIVTAQDPQTYAQRLKRFTQTIF